MIVLVILYKLFLGLAVAGMISISVATPGTYGTVAIILRLMNTYLA